MVLRILLLLGMLLSLFLVYEHFAPSASEFCTFGESFDCGIVNKSPYANLDGISYLITIDWGWPLPLIDLSGSNAFFDFITANAFLGFLTLLFVFFLSMHHAKNKGWWKIPKNKVLPVMRGILIFGVAYGFYLFLVQHILIKSYCILCLGLDVILVTSAIVACTIRRGTR